MFSDAFKVLRFAVPALVAGVFLLAGCEEKVVKTQNPLTAGPYPETNYAEVSRRNRQRNQPRGPLEQMGDFLFGWMQPAPTRAQPSAHGPGIQPAVPKITPPEPRIDPVPPTR